MSVALPPFFSYRAISSLSVDPNMWPSLRYTLLLAFRSRLFLVFGLLGLSLLGLAWLSASFSPRQPQTVVLDIGISFIRLVLPLLGILLTQEFLTKEIERKTILTTLTYPRSRTVYLLGRYAGISVILLALLLAFAVLLAVPVVVLSYGYQQATPVDLGLAYWVTMGFIWLDCLVILAFAVFLASVATVPNLVLLGGLGFMLIARSIGVTQSILADDINVVQHGASLQASLAQAQYWLPDLGLLDVRVITLYGRWDLLPVPWVWLVLVPLAYLGILLGLAAWRFSKRQFA